MPRFDLPEFLRVISEYRVGRIYIAPPVAVALAKHPMVDEYDLSCIDVIFSGAAPLDAELGHAMGKRLSCTVLQGYGMTELSPVSHCMPDDRPDLDLNSSGFAVPNVVCKLVDPATGEEVGPGGRGELWVKGPNVMSGYLNNPEATAITLDEDGYLHTGDVAEVTDEGVFSIVDRVKELIKVKGFQVAPAELEAVLRSHPGIADAAVVGVPDERAGERPKAFVVRAGDVPICAEEIVAYVAERVAAHKRVHDVEFVDAIPTSPAGKTLRRMLRDRGGAR